ncbi:uncharacterized protein LOC143283371 isoform X2 [Babylonia areolata]|uniref:uncharacterized protein LOC143283371 isoform X2 n=1 Tax=Babylonia areolata TaxID=304850 RepID=UPI003FD36A2B
MANNVHNVMYHWRLASVMMMMMMMMRVTVGLSAKSQAHGMEEKTARYLNEMEPCKVPRVLQIVKAVFHETNESFTRKELHDVYETNMTSEKEKNETDLSLRAKGPFRIRYFCAIGNHLAVNPCQGLERTTDSNTDPKLSLLILPNKTGKCAKKCHLTPTKPFMNITYNFLSVPQGSSGTAAVKYAVKKAKDWRCLKNDGYGTINATGVGTVSVMWRTDGTNMRLWFYLDGVNFSIKCEDVNESLLSCSNTKPTPTTPPTTVMTTTTPSTTITISSKSPEGPETHQNVHTFIIPVLLPVVCVIIITIVIAITVCFVKSRQQMAQINPARSGMPTEIPPPPPPPPGPPVPTPRAERQQSLNHSYTSLNIAPEDSVMDNQDKRTARNRNRVDKEVWVPLYYNS